MKPSVERCREHLILLFEGLRGPWPELEDRTSQILVTMALAVFTVSAEA